MNEIEANNGVLNDIYEETGLLDEQKAISTAKLELAEKKYILEQRFPFLKINYEISTDKSKLLEYHSEHSWFIPI